MLTANTLSSFIISERNSLAKDQVGRIKKLAINEKGIRPDAKMFRSPKQVRRRRAWRPRQRPAGSR